MKLRLKPLHEQVMVITGASSGIGLVTATMAAEQGARVVLAARNGADLDAAVSRIRATGGRAVGQAADVADPAQVAAIAATAAREFGRIDTWVNNAAVAMYGRLTDISVDDMRRQFDTNYWGQVHGSRAAVTHLSEDGGAIINVASALADRAIPLQGNYCAAKHALKAFTDTLRMELEEAGVPISVTLVKPASVDTPFFEKARTLLGVEPQPVPPVYAPEVVARAILAAATRPYRDIIAGGMGKTLSLAARAPRLADRYMERTTFTSQMTEQPTGGRPDNLYAPLPHDGGERGRNWSGHVRGTSLYTAASMHPVRSMVALGCIGVAAAALLRSRQ
ncbi:MAG TPA: SDR family oxidoreductase [Gemmatimonadales bacterium]|jgi:NAD(P)-dependent dehydrogenase (short-subunit alcohol dehydrogenase family)|nr:SDR family oxidoreductase [Gemmatimonadales bacterium]